MTAISIIIPLYNKKRYIKRTIDSVLAQTFHQFECIIVDSSDDGSTDIVKQYSDYRIIHIIHKKSGASTARNIGAGIAKSDLLAFLDADDEWTPIHLETLIYLYTNFSDACLYSTPYIKLLPDGSSMVMIFAGIPHPPWHGYIPNYFRTCAQGDVPVNSSSCAIKKDVFIKMGGFAEDLIYGEDQHLWGRIALRYPIAFSWEGTAIYHTEAEGRICNTTHLLSDDPLSAYLEEQLTKGSISDEKRNDILAYIHRRRKSIWFSNLLNNSRRGGKKMNNGLEQLISHRSSLLFNIWNKMATFFLIIYNSKIHNYSRKLQCYIHGWYILKV